MQIYPHKEHNHLEGVKSFVLREERPLDLQKLNEWMSAVVQELGEYLYRYKGILSIDGVDKRIVFKVYIRYLLLRTIESGKRAKSE